MASVNKAIIVGRLGKDPKEGATKAGKATSSFSVATQEHWQEKPDWHNIVAFDKTAEVCNMYLKKGSFVYIEGRIQTRSWEDNGVTKYITEIVADRMQMLDSKKDSVTESNAPQVEPDDVPMSWDDNNPPF